MEPAVNVPEEGLRGVLRDGLSLTGLVIRAGRRTLVDGAELELEPGRSVGLLGRSGAGKTLTSRALLGMVELEPGVVAGELVVRVGGAVHQPYRDAWGADRRTRDRRFAPLRGSALAYLPQDARGALDPLRKVGAQVARATRPGGGPPASWLGRAGFGEPEEVLDLYPHELSGGMAQRVLVAQTLARGSRFVVADEPTTGVDPSLRRELAVALRRLTAEGAGLLLVTHDLAVLGEATDDVVVLEGGRTVERLPTPTLLAGGGRSDTARALVDAHASLLAATAP